VSVLWRLRALLSATGRRRLRRITDPLSAPLGSIRAARTADRVVALTFDDGPDPASTPGVLDALARHGARGAFFVLVDRAEAHPQLIERMLDEGHDVGLHGLDHVRLTRLERGRLRTHVAGAAARLAALTGRPPRWFRPPYGSQSLASFVAARRCGMEVVVWSADCEDWVERPEEEIARQAVEASRPGAVLLLHDALAADPDDPAPDPPLDRPKIADLVLTGLAGRGYRSLTLTELLEGRRAHRTAWFRP
jgi:peptidoglycan/xylan/chitin deacetylase (PgdA/CDA1 family)